MFYNSILLASLVFREILDGENKSNCTDAILTDILTLLNLLSSNATQIAYFVSIVE